MTHLSKAPCKNCPDRSLTPPCHDTCEKYLAYKEDTDKIRKNREQTRKNDDIYMSQIIRRAKMRGKVKYGKLS